MLKAFARVLGAAVIALLALAPGLPAIAPAAVATTDRPCNASGLANLDFVLKDAHAANVRLASARGKVVVLAFWATWCLPCRAELTDLAALQRKYVAQGLQVFGISVDDGADALRAAAALLPTDYPLLTGQRRDDLQVLYGPTWDVPRTFVIDRDGLLCRRYNTTVAREQLEPTLTQLLSERPRTGPSQPRP